VSARTTAGAECRLRFAASASLFAFGERFSMHTPKEFRILFVAEALMYSTQGTTRSSLPQARSSGG